MNGAFRIGAMGMHAQQSALEAIASNIANMNTPAYKRSAVDFSEMMAEPVIGTEGATARGSATRAMTMNTVGHIFTQGELRPTGREFDIAIEGDGFIELMGTEGQIELWRGGNLKINADGFLAAANGLQLKSMIAIPDGAQSIAIGRDGVISAILPGDDQPSQLGRIELVRVKEMGQLSGMDGGLYRLPADASGVISTMPGEEGAGAIVQGALEQSNVQLTDEMVMLMMMQRAYAADAQVVQAGDQLLSIANNLRRA